MADLVTRLKVDSSEHDRKLKNAVASLRELSQTYEKDTKAGAEFAGSLGMMATRAKSAGGSASELRAAFKELSAVYSELTDKEKRSPFGRELAQSMETLKARYKETSGTLREADKALGENGKSAKSFGAEIVGLGKQLGLVGSVIGTVKGALGVLGDAFLSSESNSDAWGAALEAGKGVYQSFCIALNNGNLSGFFSNIGAVVEAATAAYEALDKLNTYNMIRGVERSKLDAENEADRAIVRRQGKDSEAGRAAQARIRARETRYKAVAEQEAGQNWDAGRKKVIEALTAAGARTDEKFVSEVITAMTDTRARRAFEKKQRGSLDYTMLASSVGPIITSTDRRNDYKKAVDDVMTDKFLSEVNQYFSGAWNAKREASSIEVRNARYVGGGSSGGKVGGVKAYTAQTQPLVMERMEVAPLLASLDSWRISKKLSDEAFSNAGRNMADFAMMRAGSADGLRGGIKMLDVEPKKLEFGKHEYSKEEKNAISIKALNEGLGQVSEAVGAGGALVGGIGDLITQLGGNSDAMKDVMTVISIANTVITVLTAAMKLNTMVNAAKPFASGGVISAASGWGGVVGGSSFAGDLVPIRANSGEVIFNQTDAGKLYDYIHNSSVLGGGSNQLRLSTEVSGSNLRIVLNNDGRRRGAGKVVL